MEFERRLIGIPQKQSLDLGDSKLHSYNRFKIELLKAKKMHKFCLKNQFEVIPRAY